ncbi:hypothetical protein AEAC466_17290 [Asticcacaulis sp. AC466]|uniref:hypothetical protein n=1 Tax=Asticcacaulis sp. AC466 TaxID=1282362 RepID=UPI0003C3D162|nr:hypothetical protein [Asticcacaulis sp. AC466]ESQ82377.1 hypothetical protein AEAC466_17290 [Asticcacaulis sp. AC466]
MSRRIFTWTGRVCVAANAAEAKVLLGAEAFTKATIYDLTEPLLTLIKHQPGSHGALESMRERSRIAEAEVSSLTEGYNNAVARSLRLQDELSQATAQQDKIVQEICDLIKANERQAERIALLEEDAVRKAAEAAELVEIRAFNATPLGDLSHLREAPVQIVDDGEEMEASYRQMAESMSPWAGSIPPVQAATPCVPPVKVKAKPGPKPKPKSETVIAVTWPDTPVILPTTPVIVPTTSETPNSSRRPLSPPAARHGEAVMTMTDECMNPDEIAKSLNAGLKANDRVNAAQVKAIQVEMRAHAKAGV